MTSHDFLVEIGSEELPPKALKRLSLAFTEGITNRLVKAGLNHGEVDSFATPRRLAVIIRQLASSQPNQNIERRGPALQAAYDPAGKPTKACEGFARSCGTSTDQLETMETEKGAWLVFRSSQPGKAAKQLLPEFVEQSLAELPIPKRMRWGASQVEFVRPVHWVIMLLGEHIIHSEILDLTTGNTTRGHRFHHPREITVSSPAAYCDLLEKEGYVVADFERRRTHIKEQIQQQAKAIKGHVVIDEDLLDEVTSLNEWPVALTGRFEERFLKIPAEALVSTMKGNQKYFHIIDDNQQMLPYFITIANLESKDPRHVIEGNERVIRPRLEDAAFFFATDQKKTLEDRLETLKPVVFQNQLGSLYDKTVRVSQLAARIADSIGGNSDWAQRAGRLSKADLMTEMVLEFPELQGTMGRYYGRINGEPEAVAVALEEQYLPRFAGDSLPATTTGSALSIADKLDTLVGIFGIGQAPTGTKDPFALRRASLGILRIIVENKLDLNLAECVQWSVELHQNLTEKNLQQYVVDYVLERFRALYEEQGLPVEVFLSVMARKPYRPLEFHQRVEAVAAFLKLETAQTLAAANKRVSNILTKEAGSEISELDLSLLTEQAEIDLSDALYRKMAEIKPDLDSRDFTSALTKLAELKEPVDAFFAGVMVMADDMKVRQNRIALLAELRSAFLQIADISLLQGKA